MIPPVPVLEVYYSSTCAPCRLELPVLAEALRNGADIRVVMLTEPTRARRELAEAAPELAARAEPVADADPRTALRAAGDADGILPFSRVQDAAGKTCRTWRGMLTVQRIRALLAECSARAASLE